MKWIGDRARPFRNQHEMKDFVMFLASMDSEVVVIGTLNSARHCLWSSSPVFNSSAVNSFQFLNFVGDPQGQGLQRVVEIAGSEFSNRAGNKRTPISFQRVVIPLLKILTQPQVVCPPSPSLPFR
jgi:hypothetical protein